MPRKYNMKKPKRSYKRRYKRKSKQPFNKKETKAIMALAQKQDDKDLEFKESYIADTALPFGPLTAGVQSSWMVRELELEIARGTNKEQRIGNEIQLRRIMVRICAHAGSEDKVKQNTVWRLIAVDKKSSILTTSATAYFDLGKYFKMPYGLKSGMLTDYQDVAKQDIKVLAKKSIQFKRDWGVYFNTTTNLSASVYKPVKECFVLQKTFKKPMDIKFKEFDEVPTGTTDNKPVDYRFFLVCTWGDVEDLHAPSSTRAPYVTTGFGNFWYTDS